MGTLGSGSLCLILEFCPAETFKKMHAIHTFTHWFSGIPGARGPQDVEKFVDPSDLRGWECQKAACAAQQHMTFFKHPWCGESETGEMLPSVSLLRPPPHLPLLVWLPGTDFASSLTG